MPTGAIRATTHEGYAAEIIGAVETAGEVEVAGAVTLGEGRERTKGVGLHDGACPLMTSTRFEVYA